MAEKEKNQIETRGRKKGCKRPEQRVRLAQGEAVYENMYTLELFNLPPIEHFSMVDIERRTAEYFEICAKYDRRPGVASYALSLGVTRKTLWAWCNGVDSAGMPEECRNYLKRVVGMFNAQMEDFMQNGKINPASGIFLMKNNYGYVDEIKQTVEHVNTLTPERSEDQLRDEYGESMIIDVDAEPIDEK